MRLPHIRRAAPEALATAKAQRWDPAEVLRVLLTEEVAGRDRSSLATRRARAAFLLRAAGVRGGMLGRLGLGRWHQGGQGGEQALEPLCRLGVPGDGEVPVGLVEDQGGQRGGGPGDRLPRPVRGAPRP